MLRHDGVLRAFHVISFQCEVDPRSQLFKLLHPYPDPHMKSPNIVTAVGTQPEMRE